MDHKTYLKSFFLFLALGLVFFISLNLLVDPYDIYQVVRVEGFNALKPAFRKHSYLGKAIAVKRIRPNTILLGTSRAETGIDPEHPGWQYKPVYNLALAAANIYEAMRYYQHANAVRPLKQVVINLDLFMFNAYWENTSNFDEARLLVNSRGEPNPPSNTDTLLTLASFDALNDSLKTIFRQSLTDNELFLRNGQRDPTFNALKIIKAGGYRKRFIKSLKVYMGPSSPLFTEYEFENYFSDPKTGKSTFDYYRTILKHAYANTIDLHLLISPLHAYYCECIRIRGLWPVFEKWKKELIRINEEEAKNAGKFPFPLWDFSGYHTISNEIIPPLGDAETQMKWYWESSHYKKELGDLVLDKIFTYDTPNRKIPSDFGVLINSGNINEHLTGITRQQRKFCCNYHEEVEFLEQLASEINAFSNKNVAGHKS